MISAITIRQTPVDVQHAVFQLPLRTLNSIGAAAGQGDHDFWYSSMRGRPVQLLRSNDPLHHPSPLAQPLVALCGGARGYVWRTCNLHHCVASKVTLGFRTGKTRPL